ncbi:MAG TPA: hypothetical protein DIC18_02805 [Clostridiales bacterium]|nr:hypothetical protein [Clostridiales bacterium]HCU56247.1 hypothetical protein [Clostridiales bacterium]
MIEDSRYEETIASIAAQAALKVEGVASLSDASAMRGKTQKRQPKSVIVERNESVVRIDVYVNAFAGVSVPDMAYDIQQNITKEVQAQTSFKVSAVNINVAGIVFNQ